MYVNKSKKGYGYYTTVKSTDVGGNEIKTSVSITFKKGSEPPEGDYRGELFFLDQDGRKRKAFFNAYRRHDGTEAVGLVLMPIEEETEFYEPQMKPERRKAEAVVIDTDDLPFY